MSATYTQAEFDEAYEIGIREGYERAVQEIDMKTGGDGEYRYCTDRDPDRHTPGPAEMIQRIVDRFDVLNLLDDATKTGRDQPDDGLPDDSKKCAICGGKHDNDVLTDICTDCEMRINEDGSP